MVIEWITRVFAVWRAVANTTVITKPLISYLSRISGTICLFRMSLLSLGEMSNWCSFRMDCGSVSTAMGTSFSLAISLSASQDLGLWLPMCIAEKRNILLASSLYRLRSVTICHVQTRVRRKHSPETCFLVIFNKSGNVSYNWSEHIFKTRCL